MIDTKTIEKVNYFCKIRKDWICYYRVFNGKRLERIIFDFQNDLDYYLNNGYNPINF